jgi:hypothetical protein
MDDKRDRARQALSRNSSTDDIERRKFICSRAKRGVDWGKDPRGGLPSSFHRRPASARPRSAKPHVSGFRPFAVNNVDFSGMEGYDHLGF